MHLFGYFFLVLNDLLTHLVLLWVVLVLQRTVILFAALLNQLLVEHLMQESRNTGVEQEFSLDLHRQRVTSLLAVLVNVGVLRHYIVSSTATKPTATEQTHPKPLWLVALLAEGDYWRLLVVSAKRASVELPPFETVPVEVVSTKDWNYLTAQLFEANGAWVFFLIFQG